MSRGRLGWKVYDEDRYVTENKSDGGNKNRYAR